MIGFDRIFWLLPMLKNFLNIIEEYIDIILLFFFYLIIILFKCIKVIKLFMYNVL